MNALSWRIKALKIIPKVSNGTFDGLKTITILSLRKNFIEELGASVFTDLVRVEELDLGQAGQPPPRSNLINKNFFRTGSAQWTRAHSLAYNTCGCSTWTIMIWPR